MCFLHMHKITASMHTDTTLSDQSVCVSAVNDWNTHVPQRTVLCLYSTVQWRDSRCTSGTRRQTWRR